MMEIFNNIWSTLSTPNEILTNVLLLCITFLIENPLSLFMLCSVFSFKPSLSEKILYVLSISIVSTFSLLFVPSPFNIVINYIFSFIAVHVFFKANFLTTIIASIFPSIFFSLAGNFVLNPFLSICNISYEMMSITSIYRIPCALLIYFVVFLLIMFFRLVKFNLTCINNFDKNTKIIITFNFILGLITIIMQLILTFNYINLLPITFTFFNFICLSLYFGLSIYSLTRVMKLADTTQKLESAEEYNKTLHILHDSVRGFKHDFDNIVTTIGGYIKTNDMEGLEKYYTQLEGDCEKVNNLYVLNPDLINNPGIYNLLTAKYNEADEKSIKINLTFLLDLNELHMKIYEFARILGILLDNAIEAASESDEKILYITFRKDFKNNINLIIIENSYKDKDIDLDNIFNKGVSGKENHTGIGLWEIRQILKKNKNVNLFTTKSDELFTQKLEIYC